MLANIANIATFVKQDNCDYRAFIKGANSAIFPIMEDIDANWIKKRLTGKRGEQTRLAEHLGISTDKLSKTLGGERRVQPEEIPRLLDFFNERITAGTESDTLLLQQIGRLNKAGQDILRKQLGALLESPELLRQPESNETNE